MCTYIHTGGCISVFLLKEREYILFHYRRALDILLQKHHKGFLWCSLASSIDLLDTLKAETSILNFKRVFVDSSSPLHCPDLS